MLIKNIVKYLWYFPTAIITTHEEPCIKYFKNFDWTKIVFQKLKKNLILISMKNSKESKYFENVIMYVWKVIN